MGKPEGTVERYLRDQARARGWLCYKFESPGTSGMPDRIVIGNGQVTFVETKAPGGHPRPLQVTRMRQMAQRGADVRVASSREEVDEILRSIETKGGHATDVEGRSA